MFSAPSKEEEQLSRSLVPLDCFAFVAAAVVPLELGRFGRGGAGSDWRRCYRYELARVDF